MANKTYISAWLADQVDDASYPFPEDFDFEAAVEQIDLWFDDQIVLDHLDELLTLLLKELNK